MTPSPAKDRALELTRRCVDRLALRIAHGIPVRAPLPPQPPGPRGSILLGNTAEGWNRPLALFTRCMKEYGPIARLRFAASSYYLLNHPDLVHHVFVENHRNYKKSRNYRGIQIVLGDGLFTSEGETWRRQRKLAQPAFHRERLAGFAQIMCSSTRELLTRLQARAGQPVQWHEEMSDLALRIVCRTLFSAEIDAQAAAIRQSVSFANEYGESAYFLPTWIPTAKNQELKRALAQFDALIYRMIAARRRSPEQPRDLLSMLMAAQDESSGEGMSDRQLRDEALTLIIGGHETTATVLDWTFHLLSQHQAIERQLRAHVLAVLGDRDPTVEDLPKLGYVTQVVQEAMRLYPPAWVMEREAIAEDTIGGYPIPAGATVAVSPYVLHRHPDFWDDPERFVPERFAPDKQRERSRYVYLPFGSGPRICIGNAFAMMEMVIIVSMLVRQLRVAPGPGKTVEPEPLMTLRPKHGLELVPHLPTCASQMEDCHAQ